MDQLIKECIDKVNRFNKTVDYQDKQQLNAYIAIFDKLKEISEIIDNHSNVEDLLTHKLEEYELEEEILDKFGPSILLYLIMKTSVISS